jgi:hypothetical protein
MYPLAVFKCLSVSDSSQACNLISRWFRDTHMDHESNWFWFVRIVDRCSEICGFNIWLTNQSNLIPSWISFLFFSARSACCSIFSLWSSSQHRKPSWKVPFVTTFMPLFSSIVQVYWRMSKLISVYHSRQTDGSSSVFLVIHGSICSSTSPTRFDYANTHRIYNFGSWFSCPSNVRWPLLDRSPWNDYFSHEPSVSFWSCSLLCVSSWISMNYSRPTWKHFVGWTSPMGSVRSNAVLACPKIESESFDMLIHLSCRSSSTRCWTFIFVSRFVNDVNAWRWNRVQCSSLSNRRRNIDVRRSLSPMRSPWRFSVNLCGYSSLTFPIICSTFSSRSNWSTITIEIIHRWTSFFDRIFSSIWLSPRLSMSSSVQHWEKKFIPTYAELTNDTKPIECRTCPISRTNSDTSSHIIDTWI